MVCTCHLVDQGIDSGKIYAKRQLDLDYSDYHRMRATVYPETAKFVTATLLEILAKGDLARPLVAQDEMRARYRPYVGVEGVRQVKAILAARRIDGARG